MSGSVSVVAFEGELNAIVKEYLDFSGFDLTLAAFMEECNGKDKPISPQDTPAFGNEKLLLVQNQMLEFIHEGKGDLYFKLWNEYLPANLRDSDSVAQKLEFYVNIYFAIYPVKYQQSTEATEEAMHNFKKFIETRGSSLSQTTEFLPFYALPFVPNPKTHPSYRELFADAWSADLKMRVEKFLTLALKSTPQPKLFEIYRGSGAEGKNLKQQLIIMNQQIVEAEKKASTYVKRHSTVQNDYHNLIGITADLVDALEATVQGRPLHFKITPEYLQQLCNRLFTSHMRTSVDLTRPGTAGDILRQSVLPPPLSITPQPEPESYPPLDWFQVKGQITEALDRKKAFILQALRWRLTQTRSVQRDQILSAFVQNDILGCTNGGAYRETIMSLLLESSDTVKQYLARLYNACASMCAGRGYLAANPDLLPALMDILRGDEKDHIAQEMVLGALQKLSLRRQLQSAMIERGVIEWLVGVLEDNDSLSDYTLEYSVALLMNLCLRTAGKKKCIGNSHQTLKVLSDLLGHDNTEIRPYVNGALYSILAIPSIREDAKAMGMEEILRCFLKEDQPDMNRQIEFIIKQLNSNENGEDYESDEEDEDEDEEEDQEMLEADLDKDEALRPSQGELTGERLLAQYTLMKPPSTAHRLRAKLGDEPLQRPSTPSRRPLDNSNNNNNNSSVPRSASRGVTPIMSHSRPATGAQRPGSGLQRPPTRSGSRPASQESQSKFASSQDFRPSSNRSDRAYRPSTKAMEKNGAGPKDIPEYTKAFGAAPKIPRTPDVSGRPISNGSSRKKPKELPPQPQYSESGPRPSSGGRSSVNADGSPRKGSSASIGKPKTPSHR